MAETLKPDFIWKVEPVSPPLIYRNCAKCKKERSFYCSEKFRINAQQRNVDIWLIYKCSNCDTTWNCSIMRQVNPRTIPPDLYDKFQLNDVETSWHYAFDYDLLKRNNARIDPSVEYVINEPDIDVTRLTKDKVLIQLDSDYRLDLRLDTLLARKLGISRKVLNDLFEQGSIKIPSDPNSDLKQKLKNHVLIEIDVHSLKQVERN